MSAMIEAIHHVTVWHQVMDDVHVAAAVLPEAVDDGENSPRRLSVRPPLLPVKLEPPGSCKRPLAVLHTVPPLFTMVHSARASYTSLARVRKLSTGLIDMTGNRRRDCSSVSVSLLLAPEDRDRAKQFPPLVV
jgi:hypothetical protein